MTQSSLYKILEVDREASQEEIRRAYRRLAKICHPDAGGGEEQFYEISHAYRILVDPDSRKYYDETGDTAATGKIVDTAFTDGIKILAAAFAGLIKAVGTDIDQIDFMKAMQDKIGKELEVCRETVDTMEENIEALERSKKRLKYAPSNESKQSKDGANVFMSIIAEQINVLQRNLPKMRRKLAAFEEAYKEVIQYESEADMLEVMRHFESASSTANSTYYYSG